MLEIGSFNEFQSLKDSEQALLAYFSTDSCNVCKVLKPKIENQVRRDFPFVKMVYIKIDKLPEAAAQNQVFTAPTILVFFNGRETIRKSRNVSVDDLMAEIGRPYSFLFGSNH